MRRYELSLIPWLGACVALVSAHALVGQNAYIANQRGDNVSVIATATNTVTATIQLGMFPQAVAVTPDGSKVYVSTSASVSVIAAATNHVTAVIPVGTSVFGLAVTPDGSRVYVAQNVGRVSVIAAATNTVIATIPVGGAGAYGIAVTPDGSKVYVTDLGFGSSSVSVIATATNTVIATVPVEGRVIGTTPVPSAPYGIAVTPDGSKVYVADSNSNNVKVIATATNKVTATIPVGTNPFGVAVTPDGSKVYVANVSSNNVSVIATATNTVTATIPVGISPEGVALTPDGSKVYVANFDSSTVSVIATASNAVTNTVPVGNGPIAFGMFIGPAATQLTQTITFGALANRPIGTPPFSISATSSSGLTVSFASLTSQVCTVSGTTVTPVATGQCTIQATQAGNSTYEAAAPVNQSLQVTQLTQTITFGALANRPFGTPPFSISATSSSGLTVSFASLTSQVCTVSGTTVTLVATGKCTIQAAQAGNATYESATRVNQSFQVTPVGQTIEPGTPLSISPGGGSGLTQTFTLTFSHPSGYQNLGVVDLVINRVLDGRQACYIAFVPSGANSGSVLLVDDRGNAEGPYSGMVLPGSGTVSNSQCSISGTGSSASGSGNTLTLMLAITFRPGFAGNRVLYLAAQDLESNSSGWYPLGAWNVPGKSPTGPAVTGMSPWGAVGSGQTYTFSFSDSYGFADLEVVNILINSAIDGRQACYVAFVPASAISGSLLLVDDAGDAGGPFSGMVLPGNATVQNSRCTINGAGSSVAASGNTLRLTLAINFTPAFNGNQVFYLAARNNTATSDWQPVGSVTIHSAGY